jgi:hypothetical protein
MYELKKSENGKCCTQNATKQMSSITTEGIMQRVQK